MKCLLGAAGDRKRPLPLPRCNAVTHAPREHRDALGACQRAARASPKHEQRAWDSTYLEPQGAAAELQLVARRHLGLHHAAAVDPGAVGGAEVAQHPAARRAGAAPRGGARPCRRRTRAGSPRSGPSTSRPPTAASSRPAGRRNRSAAGQRPRGRQVGREAAQVGRRGPSPAPARRGSRTSRCRCGPRRIRAAGGARCAPWCRRTAACRRRSSNRPSGRSGCETKLCAQLHKGALRATLPATDWPLRRLRRREGDPGEDRPRDTKRPAQGSEPGAECFGGGVR